MIETHEHAGDFQRAMSISREEALAVFHQRYPQLSVNSVKITDTLPNNCAVYVSAQLVNANRPASAANRK
jgi:hypothetical protein